MAGLLVLITQHAASNPQSTIRNQQSAINNPQSL
jgi:hypothetical protein